ncbi:unnamed protein product [Tilletia caries]|nr:unnamed protein product [Tilletia caries]
MAGVFRPALRSLASARCHAPMPPTSIAASASSQAEGQLWPESHAGPSRLSQPASRAESKERSRAPSFMAGRDRSEMVAKGHPGSVISRQPDVALQSQPARHSSYGKGKARLIDEDDQPSWLSAPDPPFQPMPTGHPAQPLLYLPSRRELLGAISDDYLGFQSAWAKAFQHSSFKEAVSILRKYSGSDDIFRQTPPRLHKLANLLFLRLLDSVQTAQDNERFATSKRLISAGPCMSMRPHLPAAQKLHTSFILYHHSDSLLVKPPQDSPANEGPSHFSGKEVRAEFATCASYKTSSFAWRFCSRAFATYARCRLRGLSSISSRRVVGSQDGYGIPLRILIPTIGALREGFCACSIISPGADDV